MIMVELYFKIKLIALAVFVLVILVFAAVVTIERVKDDRKKKKRR